jgi:hypothetical protein
MRPSLSQHAFADERGFGIIEVVVAAAVVLLVTAATFAMLSEATTSAGGAHRHEAAISLAQREVERLRQFGYAELGMTGNPTAAAPGPDQNPSNPAEYVSGANLLVRSNFRNRTSAPPPGVPALGEPFVTPAAGGPAVGSFNPTPQRLSSGGYLYDVHRFVTWVDLKCVVGAVDMCGGPRDGKRIVVAVRPAAEQNGRRRTTKPLWISTVLTDPTAVASGATPPIPPPDPTATAQHFYLYDTRCDQSVRQPVVAGHDAHDTGRSLNPLSCEASNDQSPDLMGPARTPPNPDGTEPPMFNYSQDYTFERTDDENAPGLALEPPTSDCPTSYSAATDKHRVHRWLTAPMPPGGFTSTTRSAVTVWTRTVNAIAGPAKLCVAMHKVNASGSIIGGPLASATHELPGWPVEATQIAFAFNHAGTPPATFSLAANERLLLTLSLASSSLPGGIELFYDHPTYDTVLSVGTTTPLP